MSCKEGCLDSQTCQMKEVKQQHADKFKGTCRFYKETKK